MRAAERWSPSKESTVRREGKGCKERRKVHIDKERGVSTQTQSVYSLFCMCVSGTHSTGVKYRDSPHGSKVS